MNKRQLVKYVDKITYLAADGNYTYFHFSDAPRQRFARNLSFFALDLPQFVRIHKSYLVNPDYVSYYESDGLKGASLQVGINRLPISKRRVREVKLRFNPKSTPRKMRGVWHYVSLAQES